MSCTGPDDTALGATVAVAFGGFPNACAATNITSNSAVVSAFQTCCGTASVNVIMDGCYSYCNVTSQADQQTFEKCFGSSAGVPSDLDYACSLDDESGHETPASAGSTYLGGSTGTLVFPISTDSAATASSTVAVTTTATSGQATASASANSSANSSGSAKPSSTSKASGSATSSGASASATGNAAPTVKQFSKGAIAVLALAFVGLLA